MLENGKKIISNENCVNLLQINVHGHELWGAIDEVLSGLEECKINRDMEIKIIHSCKHGQVLKNYFR